MLNSTAWHRIEIHGGVNTAYSLLETHIPGVWVLPPDEIRFEDLLESLLGGEQCTVKYREQTYTITDMISGPFGTVLVDGLKLRRAYTATCGSSHIQICRTAQGIVVIIASPNM